MRAIVMWAMMVCLKFAVLIAVLGGLAVGLAYWKQAPADTAGTGETWTCSMHPQVRLPHPGQCPICGMDLIPVSQLSAEQARIETRAGVETETIVRRKLFKELRSVGKLDYNERRVAYISSRIAGRVDKVHADFTGLEVRERDHLVEIYSPDLNIAQRELLLSLDAAEKEKATLRPGDRAFSESALEAARTKLLLWGLLPDQVREIERSRQTRTHVTIYAPIGGVIIEKMVREGQYVKDGDALYRIAELDPIWLYLNIYEYDLGWVRDGQAVDVGVEAYPGETFRGTVTFIDPAVDDATRTVRVRVNLKNGDRRLKPMMYASATIRVALRADGSPEPTGLEGKYFCRMHPEVIQDSPGACKFCKMPLDRIPEAVPPGPQAHDHSGHDHHRHPARPAGVPAGVPAVPVSAVLDTGRRKVVYRQIPSGAYELVELQLGPRAESVDEAGRRAGYFPVLDGLKEGDRVVVRGGFLLDSQRQIEGMPSLLFPKGSSGAAGHAGHGDPAAPNTGTLSGAGHKH